jgi:hypothetical protein
MENYEVRETTGIQKLHLEVSLASCFIRNKKQNSLYVSACGSGSKAPQILNLGTRIEKSVHLHVSAALCLVSTGLVLSGIRGRLEVHPLPEIESQSSIPSSVTVRLTYPGSSITRRCIPEDKIFITTAVRISDPTRKKNYFFVD